MADYYIANNRRRSGPFPEEELVQNGLTRNSWVWRKGMKEWKKAYEMPELARYLDSGPSQYVAHSEPQYRYDPNSQFRYNQQYYVGELPRMTFSESISTCFENFANFKGRARRSEFWWFTLFVNLIGLVPFIGNLASIVFFIPWLAVATRRLHDTNHSGWWLLFFYLGFIPLTGILTYVYVTFIQSLAYNTAYLSYDAPSFLEYYLTHFSAQDIGSNILLAMSASCLYILVMGVMLLVFFCTDSEMEENKYGPSPKYKYENLGY